MQYEELSTQNTLEMVSISCLDLAIEQYCFWLVFNKWPGQNSEITPTILRFLYFS